MFQKATEPGRHEKRTWNSGRFSPDWLRRTEADVVIAAIRQLALAA